MISLDEIIDNFEFLDDWEDKYKYVIELGRMLPEFPEDERTTDNKVDGCVSQVWLVKTLKSDEDGNPVIFYQGDSDAHIVKGLIALVLASVSGRKASDIHSFEMEDVFSKIGLREHLTPQRSNGLSSMVGRIKQDAAQAIENA